MSQSADAPRPTLSVVVPTYNRQRYIRRFLDFHLDAFKDAPFPIEIVVSDNGSPDGTRAVLEDYASNPMLRPVLREKTCNVYENMLTAYHHARGEFVVYLGDDDYLVPAKIYEYVQDLQNNETVIALYAPWWLIDETQDNAVIGQFYHLDQPERLAKDDLLAAASMFLDRHIFPEFAIFRRSHLMGIVDLNQDQAYWAFVWFLRALMQGEVLLMPEPFARITAVSANNKGHAGNEEVMVAWDRYRGGLEYMASFLVAAGIAANDYTLLRAKIDHFVAQRMGVAVNFHMQAKNWIETYLLGKRLAFSGIQRFDAAAWLEVRQLAALQSAVREATRLGADVVAVDPAIPDAMLAHLAPAERALTTRDPEDSRITMPWRRAIVRHDAAFAAGGANDLVVDFALVIKRFQ